MRLNIQKFQQGGQSYYSSTDLWNPETGTVSTSKSSKSSEGSDDDIKVLNNEILNAITKSGMVAETTIFEKKYADVMYKAQHEMDFSLDLIDLRTMMASILSNSKTLDNAEQRATTNKSMDDIAVNSRGSMYVLNKDGKVETVSFLLFNKNTHRALTYGELGLLRRVRPELIDNQDIISSIGNSIGIETIHSHIATILEKVGTAETKAEAIESLESILHKKSQMSTNDYYALRDMYAVASKMGLDALFETTTAVKNKNIEHAVNYIAKMLPRSMELQLMGTYIGNGGSYKDALKLKGEIIGAAVLMNNNLEITYSIGDYAKEANELSGTGAGKKSASSSKDFGLNAVESWIMGLRLTEFDLSDTLSDNLYAMTIKGSELALLTDFSNNTLGNLPLNVALDNSISPLADRSMVYIGDKRVLESDLYNILYTYDKVGKVTMPINSKNEIDWAGFRGAAQAEEYIKLHNITSIEDKNKVHEDHDSYLRYNSKGELVIANPSAVGNFILTHGYTVEDWAKINDNTLMRELDDTSAESLRSIITASYDRTSKRLGTPSTMSGYKKRKSLYKVPIFIKLDDHAALNALTYSNHGSRAPLRSLEDDMFTEQINLPVTLSDFIDGRGELMWE